MGETPMPPRMPRHAMRCPTELLDWGRRGLLPWLGRLAQGRGLPRCSIGTPIEISESEAFFVIEEKIAPLLLIWPAYRPTPRKPRPRARCPSHERAISRSPR